MRPINLIPPEERRGERAPLRQGPVAYVLVAVLALVFACSYVLVSASNSVSEREAEIGGLEQQLDASRARAEALQSFSQFRSLEQARTDTVSSLASSRFDWERVMRELALVIPSDVSLSTLTGTAGAEEDEDSAAGAATTAGLSGGPTLTMTGCAASHRSVATFLAALRDIDGVTRVGLSSSAKGDAAEGSGTGASGEGCSDPETPTFEILAAFDNAVAASSSEAPLSEAPTAPSGTAATAPTETPAPGSQGASG